MVTKKGYIKTLEAVIAVILIIAVSYTLISRHVETTPDPPLVLQGTMDFINEKIEFDENLREAIVSSKSKAKDNVSSIIKENKPMNYDFTCAICSDSSICFAGNLSLYQKPVYVSDIFIASSKTERSPKIVRIWFLKKPITKEDFIDDQAYSDFESANLNRCQQK